MTPSEVQTSAEVSPVPPPRGDGRWRALRKKLPEIAIEAASVVFAVLLALAVDEWRSGRKDQEVARQARASIVEELRANRRDLQESLAANHRLFDALGHQIRALEKDSAAALALNLNLAQLSSAAWRTAQATPASRDLGFRWMLPVSRVYELQELYSAEQAGLLGRMADMGDPSLAAVRSFRARVGLLGSLGDSLAASYARVLPPPPADSGHR
ncbi:MAG TPA: hypothetical protein VM890_05730 [Longimicrobium sp.]|nr:hypothetical protein [Longimicrobium sp.]